ncbi:MAG TPA: DUF6794 domain-containing protein [Ignavibacteriaceae bacterium]|nr:DUF6794 domain-containing protein [Ignavibacteriaceae bacterium]
MIKYLSLCFISLLLTINVFSQNSNNGKLSKNGFPIPESIEECITYLDNTFTKNVKKELKKIDEEELKNLYNIYIFDEWQEDDSTNFIKYFYDHNIEDKSDREYLVLLAYQHYLLNKPFDFIRETERIKLYNDSLKIIEALKIEEEKKERLYLETLDTIKGVYIPKDINDCIRTLDSMLSTKFKNEFMKSEDNVYREHLDSLGLWIRNNWGLRYGSRLSKYFENLGIHHPDHMAGIIRTIYFKYLNKLLIDINDEIKKEKESIPPVKSTIRFSPPILDDNYKYFLKNKRIRKLYY